MLECSPSLALRVRVGPSGSDEKLTHLTCIVCRLSFVWASFSIGDTRPVDGGPQGSMRVPISVAGYGVLFCFVPSGL